MQISPVSSSLYLGVVVGLAHGADVLFVLLVVDDAVAAGLGHAVHLSDHHALLCQLGQHGAVKHGRGAAGFQTPFRRARRPRLTSL